jgi:hypothetical protein
MDNEKRELWDRLANEPESAYRAFEGFLTLPSGERTFLEAYRRHVGNPEVAKPSDTWNRWSHEFVWRERAAAYDDHLSSLRRDAYERGMEEEAEKQGAFAERNRNRMNELMTLGYERAMEWLENAQPSDLRAQDVIQIVRLHMDAAKAFDMDREPKDEDGWTEEDDAEFADIIKEIEAEENSEEGSDESPSAGSEGEEG